jgi:hypothetical protein
MAKYLVLIYGDETRWAQAPPQWHQDNAERHKVFNANAGANVLGGNELEPAAQAVSLRPGDGDGPNVTDGPFLETKEVIGGYYLLEAADMPAAIALAGQIPEATTPFSGVEVRAVVG